MQPLRNLMPVLIVLLALAWPQTGRAQEPSAADIAILGQALDLVDRKQSFAARQLANTARSQLVRDLVLYFDLRRKSAEGDFRSIADLLTRHPDWPQKERIIKKAEAGLTGAEQPQALIAFFSRNPPQTGLGALAYINALERSGDQLGAEQAARQAWRSATLEEAEEASLLSRYRRALGPDDHLARLLFLIEEDDPEAVQQGSLTGPGYAELAAARLALRARKGNAVSLVGRVPGSLRNDPQMMIELAGYYHRKKQYANLDRHFAQMGPTNAGLPDEIWRLRFASAHRNLRNGAHSQAYQVSRDHGLFSGSGFAELEWLAGFIALERQRNPQAAFNHFKRYYQGSTTSPISRGKAAFWAARAAEAMGQRQEAKSWLSLGAAEPTSFYGQLSAARLGLPPGAGLPRQPALDQGYYARYRNGDLAQAMNALARADERWRTDVFFSSLRSRAQSQADFQSLAAMSQNLGRIDLQVKAGKAARRKGFVLIDDLFPRPTWVRPGTPEQALVLALIRQESEFNERARSHADALGLMQLLPSTAKGVAARLGLGYNRNKLVLDPGYNVTLGRRYLEEMIQRFGGTYLLALTSYNAGPHRTDKWLKSNGDPRRASTDFVLWVEAIPFAETRNYAMRVLEGLTVYRNLLGETNMLAWNGYNPAGQGAKDARQAFCCQ